MVDESNELKRRRRCRKTNQREKPRLFLTQVMREEEGSLWPEIRPRKSTKSRMEVRPDHRVEGSVVVLRHQEAKVGSVKHEEGTWRGDVTVGSSE